MDELLQSTFESDVTREECKMKVMEKNMMRLVAVQHLRTAYGIKTKNWNKNKAAVCKSTVSNSVSTENQAPVKRYGTVCSSFITVIRNSGLCMFGSPRINKFTVSALDKLLFSLLNQISILVKACPLWWAPFVLRPLSPVSLTADALCCCFVVFSHHKFL